ncbi:MAG TPA: hypothetical protein VIH90_03605 [Candidatus Saccharimonadales bacterium]
MSGYEELQHRAEIIVRGEAPDTITTPTDDGQAEVDSMEALKALNDLAFKIALQLRINGNLTEIELQKYSHTAGRTSKRRNDDLETVGSGWIVDYDYEQYMPNLGANEYAPVGVYLDRDARLYHFQGVRSKVSAGYPTGTLVLDSEVAGAFEGFSYGDMDNADELMLKLAVFALSVGAKIA